MRPKAIVYFERIVFGTILLFAPLEVYLSWDEILQDAATMSAITILIFFIFILVLFGTLTLLVSRRRSKIAMWVLIALFALNLLSFVQSIPDGLVVGSGLLFFHQFIVVLQTIGQVVALGLLLTPSARRWMNREDQKAA